MTAPISLVPSSAWQSLNQSVGGRLFSTTPMARPCYLAYNNGLGSTQTGGYDASLCYATYQGKSNSSAIAAYPGGYISTNWAGCQTSNRDCPVAFPASLTSVCEQGGIPSYYIDVRTPSDVAYGLAFAQDHSVPLVVKNTGHDYKGRSSAPASLMLWTYNVQPPIQFSSEFQPEGCAASAGPALTYGAGQGFLGIYETAHAHGMMAVGGTSPTVGASGGWLTGGGHSALSPTHGLGVDNVLEMNVVLPNGTFVTANRCQNQDIFFAMRGGGGGTFGVLMETTSRVFPEIPLQHIAVLATSLDLVNGAEQIVTLLVNNTPQWSRDGWGGYMASGGAGVAALLIDMITPNLTLDEAKVSMKPILDFASSFPSLGISVNITTEPNYLAYYNSPSAKLLSGVGVGGGTAVASRLIPAASFVTESKKAQLIKVLTNITKNAKVPGGFLMVAPYQYDLPESDSPGGPGQSSVTPAWRESYWHMLFQKSWDIGDDTYGGSGSAQAAFQETTSSADIIRAITPEGAYQNEGDTYEPNPAASFWGEANYNRLMAMKKTLDPANVLTCHQCIGWKKQDERFSCYPDVN